MSVLSLLLQFIVSGAVVVGASILAKSVDAKWAGLLVALPLMTLVALLFISPQNNIVTTERYLLSALVFMLPAALLIGTTYLLLERLGLVLALGLALIPFVIVGYFMQKILG